MKKSIAILSIFFVVASFSFSSSLKDSHDIRLKTSVSSITPAFQFEFTSGMRFPDTDKGIITNKDKNEYDSSVSYTEFGTKDAAIEVNDISMNNLNLVFTVYLANEAKCNGIYNLTLDAGGFVVTRFNVPGTVDPKSVTVTAAPDIAARVGVGARGTASSSSIDMCFNGTECSAGKLATFEVFYQKDGTLDPSQSGYYANITLEVSSNN